MWSGALISPGVLLSHSTTSLASHITIILILSILSDTMCVQMLFTVLPIYLGFLQFSLAKTMAIFLPSMALHVLVWNALHPNMHGLPEISAFEGPPAKVLSFLRGSKFFKYLYVIVRGLVCCMFSYDCYSILLLSYSILSGALESPDLLLPYPIITLAFHNTIILI